MKRCLIVCSEVYYWEPYIDFIAEKGIVCQICTSAKSVIKALENNSFDLALVSNHLEGDLPDENEFTPIVSPVKYNIHAVGSVYVAPLLEKYKIPFILLGTVIMPTKTLSGCLYANFASEFGFSDLEEILKLSGLA